MTRSRRFAYIAATLIAAVIVLIYKGPEWPFVRNHVGDWLVVQFMYTIAMLWINSRWRLHMAAGIALICVLVEVFKFFAAGMIPHTFFAEMTIGSTFDPSDMIAFGLGLATVLIVEQAQIKPKLNEQQSNPPG